MEDIRKSETENDGGKKFLKGATVLALAGILSKFLGAIFRLPLTNLIGAVGMSYYGVAYSVYSFFLIIAIAGFPVAISRMVSERTALGEYRNAYKTYKVSLSLMTVIGAISFVICFFGADSIATAMGNPGAALSLKAISPVLLFAPLVSSYRGYFQGQQTMTPTAVSEVTEQMFRVIVGLSLSFVFVKRGLKEASAGATFGASAGSVAAFLLLLCIFFIKRKSRKSLLEKSIGKEENSKKIFKELLYIAIPITIGSAIMPMMSMIDSVIIMNRLQQTGWSIKMSKTLYGLITGFCNPLIAFPQVFTDAVSISLVPAVTAAFALRNRKELEEQVKIGIKMMMVVSCPCAIGLIVLAKPILQLLYPFQTDAAFMAVHTLQVLSFGIVCLSIMRTFASTLQGIGKMNIPVINLAIGAVAKVILTYTLVGIPKINVNGAAIGTVAAYMIAAFLNFRSVKKYTKVKIKSSEVFIRPLLAAVIMGVAAYFTYKVCLLILSQSISTIIAIIIAMVVYFVMVFMLKCMTRDEILRLPKGNLLLMLADKFHLTKKIG